MTPRLASVAMILALLAPFDAWDHRVESALQKLRRPALERPMHALTNDCNPTTLCAGLLALALLGGPAGVETAQLAVLVMVPTNLAVEGLKRLTDRPRPDGEQRRSNASFPSSHAANAFALAVVMARRWRRATPLLLLGAAAIAFSRLYLNRHFPSDVLFGALLGAGVAWAVSRAWERRARRAPNARSGT